MISGWALRIVLMLLPLILFLLWLHYLRRRRAAGADETALAAARRQLRLSLMGLALLVVTVITYLAFTSGEDVDQDYVPAHMEDGKLVPPSFKPRPETTPETPSSNP